MPKLLRYLSFLLIYLGTASQAADGGERRALLVGCSRYDYLPSGQQLYGPANDVKLVRATLVEQFALPEKNITVLAEGEGKEHRPVRANIVREFEHLIETTQADDYVWIHLSGHGSRQPNQENDRDDIEMDGMDEIFCAADTRRISGSSDESVPGVIIDDQFRAWTDMLRKRGASVVIVFDSCHSGTASRGVTRARRILPEELLPSDVLSRARKRIQTRGAAVIDSSGFDIPSGIVAIYAARDHEEEKEIVPSDLPPVRENWYGLLTYSLVKAINASNEPMSYAQWLERAHSYYDELHYFTSPIPYVEGADRDQEILDTRNLVGQPPMTLTRDETGLKLSAGDLHGIKAGTVLAMYSHNQRASNRTLVGHVLATAVRPFESEVEPCEFEGSNKQWSPPMNAECEVVASGLGNWSVRVGFFGKVDRQHELKQELVEKSRQLDCLFSVTSGDELADWVILQRDDDVYLGPSSGWQEESAAGLIGPSPADGRAEWLYSTLQQIARASNLVRIATAASKTQAEAGLSIRVEATKVDLSGTSLLGIDLLALQRRATQRNDEGRRARDLLREALAAPSKELRNHDGVYCPQDQEIVRVTWKNTGETAVDVTVLYVDANYGIQVMYPAAGAQSHLLAQEERKRELFIHADPVGVEHVVVIATKADSMPRDLSWLAQPSLESVSQTRSGVSLTPVEALFQQGMFQHASTRGQATQPKLAAFAVITWEVTADNIINSD